MRFLEKQKEQTSFFRKEKIQKHFRRILKISLVVIGLVFLLEIWMVNRLSTSGDKIQELKQTRASLQLENQVLESHIAQQSSLVSLEGKAVNLGFDSIKTIEYVKIPTDLASIF